MKDEFDMQDLGEAKVILRMEICRNMKTKSVVFHHTSYLNKVLHKHNIGTFQTCGNTSTTRNKVIN